MGASSFFAADRLAAGGPEDTGEADHSGTSRSGRSRSGASPGNARCCGDERIRIMRLTTRLAIGGPGIHTVLLTERLNPARFTTQLVSGVAMECEGDILKVMGKETLHPLLMPNLSREIAVGQDIKAVRDMVRLMRAYRPQIVHTHTAKAGFVGRLAARLAGVPLVVHTFHGNVFRHYFGRSKTRLVVAIERALSRITDRIVVLSPQQQEEILGLGIGRCEQFQIVPLGLELVPYLSAEEKRGELRRDLGIEPDRPLIGTVARLVPIKAVHLFLQAAAQVLRSHPRAIFLVVGDGESRAELEAQARHMAIESSVRFLGFRSDLPRIYADLDAVVLSSLNEGTPVAVIEALAAARPVVATDVGSVRDLVQPGYSGCLVPSGDVGALVHGIMTALEQRDLAAQWGRAGRALVYPAFDINRLVQDVENLYENLLRTKT